MKFGDIAIIKTDTGDITVMYVAPDPDLMRYKDDTAWAITISGYTSFLGRAPRFPGGIYGPGDLGPIATAGKRTHWIDRGS